MAAAIREALKERSTSMAGTALIAMNSLKGRPDGFSEDEIASTAYEMATGGEPESFQLNKATALQILAMLKDKRALQLAKDLLRDSKEIGIKASAICAIGMLGSKEDIPLIEKYVKGTETRLRMPAKQAIKKIESHMQAATAVADTSLASSGGNL